MKFNKKNISLLLISFVPAFLLLIATVAAAAESGEGTVPAPAVGVNLLSGSNLSWNSLVVVSAVIFIGLLVFLGIWAWNLKLRIIISRGTRALTEAEDLRRAILEASPIGIGMVGKNDNRLGWHNRAMTEMLGYEADELKGCDVRKLYAGEEICREAGRAIKSVLKSGLNTPIETQWQRKNGSIFDCRFRFAPFNSRKYSGVVTAVDISASKEIERETIAKERRLNAILESSPDPIVVYNAEGLPTYINPAFTKVFGWTFSEIEGQIIPYVPDDQMSITIEKIKALQKYGKSLCFETQRYNKAGDVLDVLVNSATIKDVDSEEVASIVINLTDLTDKKSMQKRLLQAEKMELVGTLAGGIAHDFNNILTAINGFSEIGERKAKQNQATLNEHLQVQLAAERARNLVAQLLTFSRKSEPVNKRVDLKNMVEDSLSMIERLIPRMIGLKFEADAGKQFFINGDVNQFNQILLNLSLNAADAMPDGGNLTVRVDNVKIENESCSACHSLFTGEYVKLQVQDTGSGIDDETLQNIFLPFYTTKDIGKGTGLGLSTVFGIVKGHDGHIVCHSQIDQGTTFELFFPVAVKTGDGDGEDVVASEISMEVEEINSPVAAPEEIKSEPVPLAETKPLENSENGSQKTILVVDDEEIIREFVEESMGFYGYQVISVGSGEAALEVYKKSGDQIDLVLLDISMPGMGGFSCLKELLKLNSQVKVIMASGYFPDALKNDPLKKGASGFLNKPFKIETLEEQIRKLLE